MIFIPVLKFGICQAKIICFGTLTILCPLLLNDFLNADRFIVAVEYLKEINLWR